MKTKKLLLWIPAVLIMLLIFFFSSQNGNESSNTSGGLAHFIASLTHRDFDLLNAVRQEEILSACQHIVRKAAHFSIYAALGFCCSVPLSRSEGLSSSRRIAAAVLISAFYASTDELHQFFVPERSCSIFDVLIDTCGALTGVLLFFAAAAVIGKLLRKESSTMKEER